MTASQAAPAPRQTSEQPAQPVLGLLGFVRVLRAAGVAADAGRGLAFVAAVSELSAASPDQVYWAGRITLCSQPDDLPRYDAAFLAWFGATTARSATSEELVSLPSVSASLTGPHPQTGADTEEAEQLSTAASAEERLRHKDFSELSAAEREHLRSLLTALRYRPATRRAVRRRPARRGSVDPRATVRSMLQAGGEVARPLMHRRSRRPRRLVLLVDVSGSMTPYADALLRFAHVLTTAAPATVETFTLGTRLTRLTRALRHRDAEVALRLSAAAVPDYAGGTRLGETLKVFTDRWGQRGMARGAVVVVFSDGWERGGAELLGEQVGRLARLSRAVVWVNPHVGRAGYEPVQSGIVAALPHLHELVSGHSLEALDELLEVVAGA
ncbi:VWA domain-containing protein [Rhodococcus sp. X156]|uniref:vWA domain-containing protein n=1 Tax=Rhodococcus sp. X156 TaxID=2499145 RepID=UPI000FD8E328|nr:VWA domain-containing protein [Rhodococcus sp. X156]